jgi:hypothetical protein
MGLEGDAFCQVLCMFMSQILPTYLFCGSMARGDVSHALPIPKDPTWLYTMLLQYISLFLSSKRRPGSSSVWL